MASSDVTYLFFQRDHGEGGGVTVDADGGSPTIHSARVIRQGAGVRSRAGSVPPALLRAGSVPPRSVRAGSVAPRGVASSSSGGFASSASSRHTAVTSRAGPVHHAAATGRGTAGSRIFTAKDFGDDGIGSSSMLNGPTPKFAVTALASGRERDRIRRASITVVTATPTELHQRSRLARDALIYRADDFLSGAARDGPALNGYRPQLSPSSATVSRTFRSTTSTSRELPPSSASLSFRRASVSGPPSARQQTTTITSNTSGANRSPYLLVYDTNDVNKQTKRTPIEHFDDPKESMSSLRSRMNTAREQMSRHRVLIDRYLPVTFGPTNDVKYDVENKVSELALRMPQLDPNKRNSTRYYDNDVESRPLVLVTPYKPLPRSNKVDISPLPPIRSSFTPKMSDVRKRARSVLCKVKGDPRYFDLD